MAFITQLMAIKKEYARKALLMACNNKLPLYVINQYNHLPYQLKPGDLDKIRLSENPVDIVVIPSIFNETEYRIEQFERCQPVDIRSLRIKRIHYKKFFPTQIKSASHDEVIVSSSDRKQKYQELAREIRAQFKDKTNKEIADLIYNQLHRNDIKYLKKTDGELISVETILRNIKKR